MPAREERAALGAVKYQSNRAVLHTDTSVLPRDRRAWAAWNYQAGPSGSGRVCLHYLINRLQPLPWRQPVIVSLNPVQEIEPRQVIGEYEYAHPVLDAAAVRAQKQPGCAAGRSAAPGSAAPGPATGFTRTASHPARRRPPRSWRDSRSMPSSRRRHERAPDRLRRGAPHPPAAGAPRLRLCDLLPAAADAQPAPRRQRRAGAQPAGAAELSRPRPRRRRRRRAGLARRAAGASRHRRCRRRGLAALLSAGAGPRLQAGELLVLPPRRRRRCAPSWWR